MRGGCLSATIINVVPSAAPIALSRAPGRPYWMRGLRGAIGVSGPLFVGIAVGNVLFGTVAAIGAYLACFADDQGGAFGPRIRAMCICVVSCGVSFLVGALASPWVWLAVGLVILWTFGWGLISSVGPVPSVIAAMSATALLVAVGLIDDGGSPVSLAAVLMIGGAIPTVLTALAWPFARTSPAVRAVDNVRSGVSKVVSGCESDPPDAAERSRNAAFAAIRTARKVIRDSLPEGDPIRVELLGRVRGEERFLKQAAAVRFEIAPLIAAGDASSLSQAAEMGQQLREHVNSERAQPLAPGEERTDEPPIEVASFFERLRPAFTPGSPAFIYAVRFSVVGAIGLVGTTLLRIPHAEWVTITSWRVLRTTYAATMTRLYQRVTGNVIGGVAAALVLLISPGLYVVAAIVAVTTVFCFALRPINYGIYAIFGTWVILMLTDVGGSASVAVAFLRIVATMVGATIAVLGARWILPRWTADGAARRFGAALAADQRYAEAIEQGYGGRYDIELVTEARRGADDANGAAFSVCDQMRLEPGTTPEQLNATEAAVYLSIDLRDCLVACAAGLAKTSASRSGSDALPVRARAQAGGSDTVDQQAMVAALRRVISVLVATQGDLTTRGEQATVHELDLTDLESSLHQLRDVALR